MIQTVQGPVTPDALGVTLAHEHLLLKMPVVDDRSSEADADQCLDDEALAASELQAFADAGGRSLVELTVEGLSPSPLSLRRLADRVGVQIVAGVGLYRANTHPDWVKAAGVAQVAEHFLEALRYGIGGTVVRGGVLGELGTSSPIHPDELKALRAAAHAHMATDVGIVVGCARGSRQEHRVLDTLQAEGVDLRRIALSHMDELLDFEYHRSLAVRGAWLSFDTFGWNRAAADREKIEALLRLLGAGWMGQVLLSQDVSHRGHLMKYGGKGYAHLLRNVMPALEAAGLASEAVRELLVDNTRRFLTGESP